MTCDATTSPRSRDPPSPGMASVLAVVVHQTLEPVHVSVWLANRD